ncbi:TRM11 family methyltransferase [Rhodopila globiformis]|uniref:hypothetical protein n=1 Tax=Rhodopila globiformis TaxID=1071 RepID=UPI00195B1F1F|nr:hypothetical protein [Rhodopila globiformis]
MTVRATLRQRADYTHKFNAQSGRHGWLRLTPAYSVRIVEELIARCDHPMRILDPFCGTATTALSAACHGHQAVTTDINPFLVWFGRAKTDRYTGATIAATRDACGRALRLVARDALPPVPAPPIHRIERWWNPQELDFLQLLKAAIDHVTEPQSQPRTLLLVAFCRTLIALSNAAFNHQSMSFSPPAASAPGRDRGQVFAEAVALVLHGAGENPPGAAEVILADARAPLPYDGLFDRVVTSPPYVNRMSYIRELRPYMYWLGFLANGHDAGALDWSAIGGTWGTATSRLAAWKRPAEAFEHAELGRVLDLVADAGNRNGGILANYIAKYFGDMWVHLQNVTTMLSRDAEIHYIVGNSTFYRVLLPVERLYAAMLERIGFRSIACRPMRKRNSKVELIEFDVSAVWPGGRG